MNPTLQLYFVRHGETEWSLAGRHTGLTELPLTAHGEAEARALGPLLQALDFTAVLVSPRLRARQTSDLAGFAAVSDIDADLAEWDYGDYEGQRSEDIRARYPYWNIWRDGCPGGEVPAQVSARADRVLARLRLLGGKVLLFSHGQFGRVLAARWIQLPAMEGRHFALDPASVGILGHEHEYPARPVITLWNAQAAGPVWPPKPNRIAESTRLA